MPAYNESRTIETCLRAVLRLPFVAELIVVDDCSSDDTRSIVQGVADQDGRVQLLQHEKNQGKGAALRTGFARCSAKYVIIQDADLEYDPSDYVHVLQPMWNGRADASMGSRVLGGGPRRVLYFWHCVGNKLLTVLSNCFTGLNLTDMETGMKAMKLEVLQKLRFEQDRFGFEPEVTAKLARLRIPIYEVPISYYGRTYEEGKKIGWRDGLKALWCILKYGIWSR